MTHNAKTTFWEEQNVTGIVGGALQRPHCGSGQSLEVPGKSVLLMIGGSGQVQAGERMLRSDVGDDVAQAFSKVCGRSRSGRAFGPDGIRGTACACAQRPRIGMCQASYGPHGDLFFLLLLSEERADGPQ